MRTAVTLVLLALMATGCGGTSSSGTPNGCGMVPASKIVGLLGSDARNSSHGSPAALRSSKHTTARCESTVPKHAERYVRVVAQYHPTPQKLPTKSCSAGWAYAGTPDKYAPACQETVDGHGKTQLIVRWQPYVMHITIGRTDRDWGGDPEAALAMSRALAQHLGVKEAAGDG